MCKKINANVGTRTNSSITSALATPKCVCYTTTLLSGVVGSLSRCYIQLFALYGDNFWLTLARLIAAFVNGGTHAADCTTFTGIIIEDIEFYATIAIIHYKEQGMQAITKPMFQSFIGSYFTTETTPSI